METTPSKTYNDLAPFYRTMFSRKIDKAEDELIYAYLKQKESLITLDYGCGVGTYAEKIDPIQYVGIDNSGNMIEEAEARIEELKIANCVFFRRDMHDINLKNRKGKFGLAVSTFCSIGHSSNPDIIAKSICEMLAPGGHFFLMLPGKRYAGRKIKRTVGHVNTFSRERAGKIFGPAFGLKTGRVWSFNVYGDTMQKFLPKFFLKLYLILETKIFGNTNKGHYVIIEGFKPLK